MQKIRVLVFQYKVIYLDPDANLRKFERLLRRYKDFAPDLVIFPEYALTGPLYGHYDLAFHSASNTFTKVTDLAKKYSIFLVPGSFVRLKGDKRYNSTCLINPVGRNLGFYDKQCLWSSERRYITKGKKVKVFNTKIGKIALQICADLHSSRISNTYRNLEPDLIINTAMWSWEDTKTSSKKLVPQNIQIDQAEHLIRARAIENRAFAVFCNYGYKLTIQAKRKYKETSIGNTMIISPYGNIMARVITNRAEALLAELDISKTHWSRYNY